MEAHYLELTAAIGHVGALGNLAQFVANVVGDEKFITWLWHYAVALGHKS